MKISDLFHVSAGNKFDMNKMVIDATGVPFISRTSQNNGTAARVAKNDTSPFPAGVITVALGGSVLSSFLQPEPFYTGQNVAVLTSRDTMESTELLYYCAAIYSNAYRFNACGREANRFLRALEIPARDEVPMWVHNPSLLKIEKLSEPLVNKSVDALDTTTWKKFEFQELFEINRGIGPRQKELDGRGVTPLVTSTDSNNGVSGFTSMPPTHEGNTISVNRNGSVGEAFYQAHPFCSTEDVHIFSPKFPLTPAIAMFLIALIRQEKYRYGYGRKWGLQRMKTSVLKLPVDINNRPDWNFLEEYIQKLPFSSQLSIRS